MALFALTPSAVSKFPFPTAAFPPTLSNIPYSLLLAGHKGLETRGDSKSQLVDVRWLILAVDLYPNSSFK